MHDSNKVVIHWFRRDLRLDDNHALFKALSSNLPVLPLFILDKTILDELEPNDSRVTFIHQQLLKLNAQLKEHGSSLLVLHGDPMTCWNRLMNKYSLEAVYFNHDYEPYAIQRDQEISNLLTAKKIKVLSYKDHVIFERNEIIKDDGLPYTVYTPYSKKWKLKLSQTPLHNYTTAPLFSNFYKTSTFEIPALNDIGFIKSTITAPAYSLSKLLLENYESNRNIPSVEGTSRVSVHLRFGTISIRSCVQAALNGSESWLNELCWREFYMCMLWHFPYIEKRAFKSQYDWIPWINDETLFDRWCNAQTGYPIVDAGIKELLLTGHMHNRVRMIVASFLTKHLLIDWRWGESFFAKHLLDFELSSNNGGWQWASGSGCDAAPYFRIFNPYEQTKRFDPELKYIKKWLPEYESANYPSPIVDHQFARNRCLEVYKKALSKK